jgi:hypothetical protein
MRKPSARGSNKSHTTARVKLCTPTKQQGESLKTVDIQSHLQNIYFIIIELLTTTIIHRRVQHNTCSIVTLAKSWTVSLSDFSLVYVPPALLPQNLEKLIFNYLDKHHLLATFHK